MKVEVKWKSDMLFEAVDDRNHKLLIDAPEESGGSDSSFRPKELLLTAVAGCSAMDVIAILKKMRIVPAYFNVHASGETVEDHPRVFKSIHLVYEISSEVSEDKVKRAVDLSFDLYCGVMAMLKQASPITFEIKTKDVSL